MAIVDIGATPGMWRMDRMSGRASPPMLASLKWLKSKRSTVNSVDARYGAA